MLLSITSATSSLRRCDLMSSCHRHCESLTAVRNRPTGHGGRSPPRWRVPAKHHLGESGRGAGTQARLSSTSLTPSLMAGSQQKLRLSCCGVLRKSGGRYAKESASLTLTLIGWEVLERVSELAEQAGGLDGVLPRVDHGRVYHFVLFWNKVEGKPPWLDQVLRKLARYAPPPSFGFLGGA